MEALRSQHRQSDRGRIASLLHHPPIPFALHAEMERNEGYADLVLAPMIARHASLRHGYVLEVKYLKRGETGAAKAAAALRAAIEQLRGYLADARLAKTHPGVWFTGVALVFRGWELAHAEAVGADGATSH